MDEFVTLVKSGMDWKTYDRKFPIWNRPSRELFTNFVARKLQEKFEKVPSTLSLRICRANKNHLFVDAEADGSDVVQGEIVWMPNLNNFRGHLLLNPPSGEDLQRDEIEYLRQQQWTFTKWTPSKPEQTHDHCRICWEALYEQIDSEGYTDTYDWVCSTCYTQHLAS